MVRTRVGYAGGTKADPTYHNLGDHSETVQIDYDPRVISYQDLLEVVWEHYRPLTPSFSTQYATILFTHGAEQRRLALAAVERWQRQSGKTVHLDVRPAGPFHPAEDYHQKYSLKHSGELLAELRRAYPKEQDLVRSTVAARVNGYLAGYGSRSELEAEIDRYGLSASGRQRLMRSVRRR